MDRLDVNSLNYILFVHNGEIRGMNREYVEGRCQWVEMFNRAGRWLVDKPRKV